MRTVPGSGAQFTPIFNSEYGIESFVIDSVGEGYDPLDPPDIEILNRTEPLIAGSFYPIIRSGEIVRIAVIDSGLGYEPLVLPGGIKIGIATTSFVESSLLVQRGPDDSPYLSVASTESHIIMAVEGSNGSSILEDGYNKAILGTIVGISNTITPDNSLNLNRFYGFFDPFPAYFTSGLGTDAKFSAFIVYESSTGNPISTSVILREGGRGYAIGDTVSISGTFMNGTSPTNDLSFTVSAVANTRIPSEADTVYQNISGSTIVGAGTSAIFEIARDSLGDIVRISVVDGGVGYALTDIIGIAGTYVGGVSPADDIFLSPKVLGADKLPSKVYINKLNDNNFTVSGLSTSGKLNLLSYGEGLQSFEYEDSDESVIISIDNVVQSSLYKTDLLVGLASTVGYSTDKIFFTGIGSIRSTDIIQLGSEYIKINTIGIGATNEFGVTRGYLGTRSYYHPVGTAVTILRGDFNIDKDRIHFTTPPYGPTGYEGLKVSSTFSGRAFSRRFDPGTPNDKNLIFDDLSTQFVGSSSTEFYLTSNENTIVGIYTDTNSVLTSNIDISNNPLVFINNVPQISNADFVVDNPGRNRIRFLTGAPSAGRIVRVGINSGFGYAPLIGAGATVSIGAGGTISNITLMGGGSGYRDVPEIEIIDSTGVGASFTATIGAGGSITSISIVNAGSGYTSARVSIGIPTGYYSVPLVYADGNSGNGENARCDLIIGNTGDVIRFEMSDPGQYYKVGDILTPSGITTNPQVGAAFTAFEITVENILTDKFSGFYPGQFVQFDDISPFFNGLKRKFTLTVTQAGQTEVLSLKVDPSSDMNLENNIFVFLNDILQAPDVAYRFDGSRLIFSQPPVPNSKCTILYFRGSDLDVEQIDPPKTIKEGDTVQIGDNILDPTDRPQFERIVKKIVTSNSLDTFTYDSVGIDTGADAQRPLNWIKQTQDRIINGVLYSKSRPDLKSRVEPTAKLIKSLRAGDNVIYVDNAYPIFTDVDGLTEDIRDVNIVDTGEVRPTISKAVVSAASTISGISIIDGGTGYYRLNDPVVAISSASIRRKDPIFGWTGISTTSGISTTNTFSQITIGSPIVAVGSSGVLGITTNGIEWSEDYIGYGNTINFNSIISSGGNRFFAAGDYGKLVTTTGIGTVLTNPWTEIRLLKEVVVLGLPEPVIEFSTFNGSFNDITYSQIRDTTVVVGDGPTIFTGVGIGTTAFYQRTPPIFAPLNSVTNNDSVFVTVGDSASILYSNDGGFIWQSIVNVPSTRNLHDVIWTGTRFVAVGENATIFTSLSGFSGWTKIVPNISDHLYKIKYEYDVYVATNHNGELLFSLDLQYWTLRNTNQSNTISDLAFIPAPPPPELRNPLDTIIAEEGRYILVGAGGTIMYSDPVYNRASATATLTNGTVTSINIINPGFGYVSSPPPPIIVESGTPLQEKVYSIKAKGDFGNIVYVGVGNSYIDFQLKSDTYDNSTLGIGYSSLDSFGISNSQIEVGDYFIITDSNTEIPAGLGLTGITTSTGGLNNYDESKIGTAYTTLNGVYRAERVSEPYAGIVTVRCMFDYHNGGAIQVNTNNNENGIHGKYSWGKIYDFQNRAVFSPKNFIVNTDNGLVGISTSADVYRTRGLI